VNEISSNLTQKQLTKELLIDALSNSRHVKFEVVSNSMAPILNPGDQVIVESKTDESFLSGDIVVFNQSTELIVHRLLSFDDNDLAQTLGDNHLHIDPPVIRAEIIGRVVKIIKRDRVVDLVKMEWVTINRFIGWCGRWELCLYRFNENFNRKPFLHRMLWFPYRIITRIGIRAVLKLFEI